MSTSKVGPGGGLHGPQEEKPKKTKAQGKVDEFFKLKEKPAPLKKDVSFSAKAIGALQKVPSRIMGFIMSSSAPISPTLVDKENRAGAVSPDSTEEATSVSSKSGLSGKMETLYERITDVGLELSIPERLSDFAKFKKLGGELKKLKGTEEYDNLSKQYGEYRKGIREMGYGKQILDLFLSDEISPNMRATMRVKLGEISKLMDTSHNIRSICEESDNIISNMKTDKTINKFQGMEDSRALVLKKNEEDLKKLEGAFATAKNGLSIERKRGKDPKKIADFEAALERLGEKLGEADKKVTEAKKRLLDISIKLKGFRGEYEDKYKGVYGNGIHSLSQLPKEDDKPFSQYIKEVCGKSSSELKSVQKKMKALQEEGKGAKDPQQLKALQEKMDLIKEKMQVKQRELEQRPEMKKHIETLQSHLSYNMRQRKYPPPMPKSMEFFSTVDRLLRGYAAKEIEESLY